MKAGWFARSTSILLALYLIFPTVVVVVTSFSAGSTIRFPPPGYSVRWYQEVLNDGRWMDAFSNSLQVGLLAAIIAAFLGVSLALLAVRGNLLPPNAVNVLAVTPMVVPTVVLGIGFYAVAVWLGITGTVVGLAVAHAAIGTPFVFVSVVAVLSGVDASVEEAARASGANEWVTLTRITLPLIAPSVFIGAVLAFVVSWDEVIIAGFMNAPWFRTLPVVILGEVQSGAEPSTSAVATLATLATILIMATAFLLVGLKDRRRRRKGQLSK